MKLKIEDNCMCCGIYIEAFPEVFEMSEESGVMQVMIEEIPLELEEKVHEAVENCGVSAIVILQ